MLILGFEGLAMSALTAQFVCPWPCLVSHTPKPVSTQYWQDEILFEIAGAIGTPIIIDENTRNNSFGHYARVLVDINFAGFIPDTLCFERDNFSFDIEIEYEHPRYGDKAQSYAVNSLTEC
uniref:Uncharacterized protein n=1 Tax=Medicago truncatula TaxID=3880 RepID=A2Q355_MEDTR|nr:hypothetical protein MtrDRAFT_AC154867g15v2 [Medicago truncatula]